MRLDLAVAQTFELSRRAAREAVRAGRVDVDGVVCDRPGSELEPGAALSFDPNRPARHRVSTKLSVLAEDKEFLVVEKPAGLLSVPTAEREQETLLARVSDFLQKRYRRRPYVGVAHRLDKDTSGSLVFGRSRSTLSRLQELFRTHRIEREYLAIVEGNPPESGTFSADLVRDRGDRRRGIARRGQGGRRAVTRYRVLERLGEAATLVSIELETGRTHQIRVHFASAGYPVLGDPVYRPRHAPPPPIPVPRQMLHARRLGFPHPETGEPVRTESAPPEDFQDALRRLRNRRRAEEKSRARDSIRAGNPPKKKEPRQGRGSPRHGF